jgi:hypothetical protein
MPKRLKIAVLLLALVAMLGVSAASNSPAHFHLNSSANRCDLCFTAHMVGVQSPGVQPVHCPEISGRVALLLPYFGYDLSSIRALSSRGPPSSTL